MMWEDSIVATCNFRIINGSFSDGLRFPQVYFLDVLQVRLVVNLCAALPIKKTPHL